MAGGGGGGGGAVGGVGAAGAAGAVSGASAASSVSSMRAVKQLQSAASATAPAQASQVHISSAARAHGVRGASHHAHGNQFGKLDDALLADALLALMNPHKKHHHDGIGGALMAAEAVKMYQSVQAMSGTHAMGGATAAVTAPAAAAHA
jgi:hypothetical protein